MVPGWPAQPVGHRLAGQDQVGGGQSDVDRGPGGVVRALDQRRHGLEAPVAEARRRARRGRRRAHARPESGVDDGVGDGLGQALLAVHLLPRRAEEAHEPRIVHGLDRPGAVADGLDEAEGLRRLHQGLVDLVGPGRQLVLRHRPSELDLQGGRMAAVDRRPGDRDHRPHLRGPARPTAGPGRLVPSRPRGGLLIRPSDGRNDEQAAP